jgi:hypothetical protein
MIDAKLRRQLAQDLRSLLAGRVTNDAFDDLYYEHYADSDDLAVQEIARFAWSFYSSDTLTAYRLRGRYRVGKPTRRIAAKAVLFLRTIDDYSYPPFPQNNILASYFIGGLGWLRNCTAIAILLISIIAAISQDFTTACLCAAPALLFLSFSIAHGIGLLPWTWIEQNRVTVPWDNGYWPFPIPKVPTETQPSSEM